MDKETIHLIKRLKRQIGTCCSLMFVVILVTALFHFNLFPKSSPAPTEIQLDNSFDSRFDISLLADSEVDEKVRYGYELFAKTPKYIGPNNGDPNNIYSGNGLACNNCHLQSGTKPFSAPLIGIINRFPQFREGKTK